MQAVAREGIPAETGWSPHEAVWNYNAAFVAEVYLWLGMRQAANDTFVGFLEPRQPPILLAGRAAFAGGAARIVSRGHAAQLGQR